MTPREHGMKAALEIFGNLDDQFHDEYAEVIVQACEAAARDVRIEPGRGGAANAGGGGVGGMGGGVGYIGGTGIGFAALGGGAGCCGGNGRATGGGVGGSTPDAAAFAYSVVDIPSDPAALRAASPEAELMLLISTMPKCDSYRCQRPATYECGVCDYCDDHASPKDERRKEKTIAPTIRNIEKRLGIAAVPSESSSESLLTNPNSHPFDIFAHDDSEGPTGLAAALHAAAVWPEFAEFMYRSDELFAALSPNSDGHIEREWCDAFKKISGVPFPYKRHERDLVARRWRWEWRKKKSPWE